MKSKIFRKRRQCGISRVDVSKMLLMLALTICSGATSAGDVLERCGDVHDPYRDGVSKIIDKAVSQRSSLQLTTIPSFEAESGLRLVGTQLYFVQFQTSFWVGSYPSNLKDGGRMDFLKAKISTKVRDAPMNSILAARVARIYGKAIDHATKARQSGVDGVSFYYSKSDGACAYAWSPKPRTRNGLLVDLHSRLERHTRYVRAADLQRSESDMGKLLQRIESAEHGQ